jgi:hypothetical protein
VLPILESPLFLSPNMTLGTGGETNAPILQRDLSSRRIASASTRRPDLTSSPESFRA